MPDQDMNARYGLSQSAAGCSLRTSDSASLSPGLVGSLYCVHFVLLWLQARKRSGTAEPNSLGISFLLSERARLPASATPIPAPDSVCFQIYFEEDVTMFGKSLSRRNLLSNGLCL